MRVGQEKNNTLTQTHLQGEGRIFNSVRYNALKCNTKMWLKHEIASEI